MTASNLAASPPITLRSALRDVLDAGVEYVNSKVADKVEGWSDDVGDLEENLDEVAATGGPMEQAAYQGVKAEVQGKNPVWAAMKGAWAGASWQLRLTAVLIVVAVLLLAPVALVLLVLALLITAVVAAIRAATR